MSAIPPGRTAEPPVAARGAWIPETDAERAAIREQLERVLGSPHFKNSKRYPGLLRYVVEHALDGHIQHLKERTLGVEVFHRDPDYDTNVDPVVRTTAVEIRKRIAQYYHEPGHESEIRIDFPPGSYLPEFRLPTERVPVEVTPPDVHRWRKTMPMAVAVGVATLAVALTLVWTRPWISPNALDRFWKPVWDSPAPVLFLIGGQGAVPAARGEDSPAPPPPQAASAMSLVELMREEKVAFADATTMAKLAGLMTARGKLFHIRRYQAARFEDLRDGPVVLIGAFNNEWTLRLVGQRFRFNKIPGTDDGWISDQQNPGAMKWMVHMASPYAKVGEDYAVISRVLDPTTGRIVVTAAGISKFGTAAAGEFLTEPSYLQDAVKNAPRDWDRKNIQVVIATKLMGDGSGPPRVVATYFW